MKAPSRENTEDVAALPNQEFEWLPWSYWQCEGERCRVAEERNVADKVVYAV